MTKEYKSKDKNIDLTYIPNFLTKENADKLFNLLENNLEYNSDKDSMVFLYGRFVKIPRKQVAYGDKNTYYTFSGNKVLAKDWNEKNEICKVLLELKNKIEEQTNSKFNFVLINKYADGNSYINKHKDDEKQLGDNPVLAGLSLDQERQIVFTHDNDKDKINFSTEHGSLYIMKDPTNKFWKHEITKTKSKQKPRISLTFRFMH